MKMIEEVLYQMALILEQHPAVGVCLCAIALMHWATLVMSILDRDRDARHARKVPYVLARHQVECADGYAAEAAAELTRVFEEGILADLARRNPRYGRMVHSVFERLAVVHAALQAEIAAHRAEAQKLVDQPSLTLAQIEAFTAQAEPLHARFQSYIRLPMSIDTDYPGGSIETRIERLHKRLDATGTPRAKLRAV